MLSFKIGNTTVHLWPVIVIFLIAIVGAVIHAILLFNRNKKMVELCRTGEYSGSIALAQKQLNHYRNTLKNKNTKSAMEMIYLHLAISNLGLSNDEEFIHNITQVADDNTEKHFWLSLFYLLKNDSTSFQKHYDILSFRNANANYLSYLLSIKQLQEHDDSDARVVLSTLKSKLNFKLLQDISQKIVEH